MLMMAKLMTMTYIVTIFTIIDGQDDDFDYTTINLNHGYGNDFELDHLHDVDISKGVERGGNYDNNDTIDDNGDIHIGLEGTLRIIKIIYQVNFWDRSFRYVRQIVGYC